MVMQAAADFLVGVSNPGADFLVGVSNPGAANMAAAPPPASTDQDSNCRPKSLRPGTLPFDRGWM